MRIWVLGNVALARGDYSEAKIHATAAETAVQGMESSAAQAKQAESFLLLGKIGLSQGQASSSVKQALQAKDLFKALEASDPVYLNRYAESLLVLSQIELKARNYESVLKNAEKARDIYQQGDRDGEARSLVILSEASRSLGDNDAALQQARQALSLYQEMGNRAGEAKALEALGASLQAQHRYQQAKSAYDISSSIQDNVQAQRQKFLDAQQQRGIIPNIAHYVDLAFPFVRSFIPGGMGRAGFWLARALGLASSAVNVAEQANTRLNLGVALLSLNEVDFG